MSFSKKTYNEVLAVLNCFPAEEYNRIPKDKIEFFENNKDQNCYFNINPLIDLSKQNISKEANVIILKLFEDYFATEEQNNKVKSILEYNQNIRDQEKRKKYHPDNLFKNKKM